MKTISITKPTDIQRTMSKEFANLCVSTNVDKYKERKQYDVAKIIRDIYIGKCAEWSVYNALCEMNKNTTCPDLEIYGANKKSFDADIQYGDDFEYKIHVKSYYPSSTEVSWVFQVEDSLVANPSDKDILALVNLDRDGDGEVHLVFAKDMVGKYADPLMKKYKGIKRCLYLKDLV